MGPSRVKALNFVGALLFSRKGLSSPEVMHGKNWQLHQ